MGMTTVAEVSMSSQIPGEYPIVLAPHHHNLYELGYPKAKSQRFLLRITPCPLNGRLLSMLERRLRQGADCASAGRECCRYLWRCISPNPKRVLSEEKYCSLQYLRLLKLLVKCLAVHASAGKGTDPDGEA